MGQATGYRYYDLGGIDRRVAELLGNRQPIPEAFCGHPGRSSSALAATRFSFPRAWYFTFVPFGHVAAQLALCLAASKRLIPTVHRSLP